MSPWRYSALVQPSSAGSKRRRAMPSTRSTASLRSSAAISGLPISPVGPVTATVSAIEGSLSCPAMAAEPMQVVLDVFPPELREGKLDMCELIDDEPFWARIDKLFAEDADVKFLTPDEGRMGGMAGPFRGP